MTARALSQQRPFIDLSQASPVPKRLRYGPGAVNLTIGPQVGPAAHMAAFLRPSGSRLKRVTEEHLELLVGGPVRYEDRAASA